MASFSAVGDGDATVTSSTSYPCETAQPACYPPDRLFQVSVRVVG
jgi:hypothetical protein